MCVKYHECRCMFKKIHLVNVSVLIASNLALFFGVRLERRKVIKKQTYMKLKHANSILETFKYFCQKSSKSTSIILSYTVSKLVHFLRHSVYMFTTATERGRVGRGDEV